MLRLLRRDPIELATYLNEYITIENGSHLKQQEFRALMLKSQTKRPMALYPSADDQTLHASCYSSMSLRLSPDSQ